MTEPIQPQPEEPSNIDRSIDDRIGLTDRVVGHKRDASGVSEGESVRVSGPEARTASADFEPNESVLYQVTGPATRGEEGSCETAQLLVQKLNQSGEIWDERLEPGEQDVDWQTRNGEQVLSIQVTRVPHSRLWWRKLGTGGQASQQESADQAADELMDAIAAKAHLVRNVRQRAALVLALDARDTPAFALGGVVGRFRQRHGQQVADLGFRAVWVVGPMVELITRVDE